MAAMLIDTGNIVVGCDHTIPCRLWFHPFITGTFSRSISGAVVLNSEAFSAGVN